MRLTTSWNWYWYRWMPYKQRKIGDRGCTGSCNNNKQESLLQPTVWQTQQTQNYMQTILKQDGIKLYNIWLSQNPFHSCLSIPINLKGDHATLGLIWTQVEDSGWVLLVDMVLGTPAACIPKWHSTICHATLLNFNKYPITWMEYHITVAAKAREQWLLTVTCEFATIGSHTIHPLKGSLYYGQLKAIGKHLHAICHTDGHNLHCNRPTQPRCQL